MALHIAGIFPFNLNEVWQEGVLNGIGLGATKHEVKRDLFSRYLSKSSHKTSMLIQEVAAIERILLVILFHV